MFNLVTCSHQGIDLHLKVTCKPAHLFCDHSFILCVRAGYFPLFLESSISEHHTCRPIWSLSLLSTLDLNISFSHYLHQFSCSSPSASLLTAPPTPKSFLWMDIRSVHVHRIQSASLRYHFQSVLLIQQTFVHGNKLAFQWFYLSYLKFVQTQTRRPPLAQLFSRFALLAGHLLAAVVLQLFALVVVRSHLQQPAALDLNHLPTRTRRLKCVSWQEFKSLLH